jgi:cytochrome b561
VLALVRQNRYMLPQRVLHWLLGLWAASAAGIVRATIRTAIAKRIGKLLWCRFAHVIVRRRLSD